MQEVKFLVHSPRKTASSSMDRFLMKFGAVLRVHYLYWKDAADFYKQNLWKDANAEYGITIIRNPVDRNISDYWEHCRQHPNGETGLQHFLASYKHDLAINFPKMELEPRWGVDIFSKEYTPPYTRFGNLIVTRIEDMIGDEFPREGAGGYDKSAIKVPDSYRNRLYNTKYYKHFYS